MFQRLSQGIICAMMLTLLVVPTVVFAEETPATPVAAEASEVKINPKTNCPDTPAYKNKVCLTNPLKDNKVTAGAIINTIIQGALGMVGALALLMLVLGGFRWLTSAGNTEKIEAGTKTMLWAVIGLFLVLSSYIILITFTKYLTGRSVGSTGVNVLYYFV